MAEAQSGGGGMSFGGMFSMILGSLTDSIGSFYAAKSKQYGYQIAAQNSDLEATVSGLNARRAEQDAEFELKAGQQAIGRLGLQTAQAKGAVRASSAASGIVGGVGSAAETQASIQLAHDMDALNISVNSVRASEDLRTQAVNYRARQDLAMVDARTARRSARQINPWAQMGMSLLGGAGTVADKWQASQAGGRY